MGAKINIPAREGEKRDQLKFHIEFLIDLFIELPINLLRSLAKSNQE